MTTAALTFSTKDVGRPEKEGGGRSRIRGGGGCESFKNAPPSPLIFLFVFTAPPTCDVTVMRGGEADEENSRS